MEKKRWTVDEAVERFWEMAETADVKHSSAIQVHVADRVPIALLDGRNIWRYSPVGGECELVRLQVSAPEPGRYRGTATVVQTALGIKPYVGFFGALKLKDEVGVEFEVDATKNIEWLDNVTHATPAPVKEGFIKCGDGTEQPGVVTCHHVMFGGAPVKDYRVPVPYKGEYGVALCAACFDGQGKSGERGIYCYHCYLKSQNRVRVTETYVVVANDGETADLTRESDGWEGHVHRSGTGLSVAEFKMKFAVDDTVEFHRMVERGSVEAVGAGN